ncbi:MAG: serpin family protein [Verrucomicrobia bacterium]|nr:MAG: serpin family protein [Verrucomicrobiota bacterium]
MNSKSLFCSLSALSMFCAASSLFAADSGPAAAATNQIGLDLYRKLAPGDNLCLSPYSIENALAMTFAGAEGPTRDEMARVLHLPKDESAPAAFGDLQRQLQEMSERSVQAVAKSGEFGGPKEPITLAIANRLFAQKSYDFRETFFALVKERYGAPLELVDFAKNASGATRQINAWVLEQTRQRIRDLIPPDGLKADTRLVLANAIYLKAPWAEPFSADATKPEPFHARGSTAVNVPTMHAQRAYGYAKRDGFSAVSVPYNADLQFVVLLPDETNGLPALEKKLTSATLAECAKLERRELDLYLPKFKFEPPTLNLGSTLQALGMKTAFDQPPGSSNFDRMAPRKPNDYLFISQIFHKTFIAVDEKGTEAAAATAVAMAMATGMHNPAKPLEVKIDRPFVYAIQHVQSGTCLFLGRVTDPR